VPTTKLLRFFIGFLDVLAPKTSKKPIKKRNHLVVGTVYGLIVVEFSLGRVIQSNGSKTTYTFYKTPIF